MGSNSMQSGMTATVRRRRWLAVLIYPLFLTLVSCFGDGPTNPEQDPTLNTFTVSGTLKTVDGSTLSGTDLYAISFAAGSSIDDTGNFTLEIPESDRFQIICFVHTESGAPVYLGLYNPVTESLEADSSSTVKALALLNVYLVCSTYEQRVSYLEELALHSKFDDLVRMVADAHREDAQHALDYLYYPDIFQTSAEFMKDTMIALSSIEGPWKEPEPPTIAAYPGGGLLFVNPRQIYYAAGIYPNAENLDHVTTLSPPKSFSSYEFGWPPETGADPVETRSNLADGYYRLFLTGGFDPEHFANWNDSEARATSLNLGQSFLYLLDLALGAFPEPDRDELDNQLVIESSRAASLKTALNRNRSVDFVREIAGLMAEESSSLVDWIWNNRRDEAERRYMQNVASLLHDFMIVFDLLDFDEEGGPFFRDLVHEMEDVEYFVILESDSLTFTEENYPPQPDFDITPGSGTAETDFYFDATATSDDVDSIGVLEFRWDWNGDSIFDTDWSSSPTVSHRFDSTGVHTVFLQVRDSAGLTGSLSHRLQIFNGTGSRPEQVKIYLNGLPYSSLALETILLELGYRPGLGDSSIQAISSEEIGSETLLPWRDLVIIANDQDQLFYDAYAEHQFRFSNFIYQGGTMLWETCANPISGSIEQAGIVLPGAVTLIHEPDEFNFPADPVLPLVAGLPDTMDHLFASNRSFENIPEEAAIYCVDSENRPTLIEFTLGDGRVVLSGQPLEHQYDTIFGNPDMEELLPRILAYLTGS